MFKFKKSLLVAGIALASLSSTQAASVTGSVKFSVDIPEIIVLYHWEEAQLKLTANDGFRYPDATVRKLEDSISAGTYSINPVVTTTTDPLSKLGSKNDGKILVKLVNSWGVRSITKKDPKLTLATNGTTLQSNTGSETIAIANQKLVCAACTGASNTEKTVTKGWAVKTGNIEFTLDLSSITKNGVYSSGGNNSKTFDLTFATDNTP